MPTRPTRAAVPPALTALLLAAVLPALPAAAAPAPTTPPSASPSAASPSAATVPPADGRGRPHRTTQPAAKPGGDPTGSPTTKPTGRPSGPATGDLTDPSLKDLAQQIVSSAENSSLDWKAQFGYIEDIKDGRGYTAGIVGFCSGTGDMLELVRHYRTLKPDNVLAKYLPALEKLDGSGSHAGLDPDFTADWKRAVQDPTFRKAQEDERDRVYFDPAVAQAKSDGLHALGQLAYYDAIVMHGPGNSSDSFGGIRAAALRKAKPPAQGGDEKTYLAAFLDARAAAMRTEAAHSDTSRVDTAQRVFLEAGNLDLHTPLRWKVYGQSFHIDG
ncbi:chitosanase [Streptomyces sp. BE20]|uniref:chitosanase n=1 Tax=unclassified Streptomyces TaxID=2593676 RepID=UPI002E76AFFA|nr:MULTISPECIES: chitosanase [unclassified Streptomyces]MED7955008.1 chitosanase [Streptomyces sp. BE303]MEE1828017.1 chitosanase [Streptomyces sp. BE20]